MQVRLSLLGKCEVVVDGRIISTFRSAKIPAILGLLAHHRKGLTREQIAATLWPHARREEGLHNFRQCLLYIRKSIHPHTIVATKKEVVLNAEVSADIDVLSELSNQINTTDFANVGLSLGGFVYHGDFLEGCEEVWIYPIRHSYQTQYVNLLQLHARQQRTDRPQQALDALSSAIQLEPFNESLRADQISILRQMGSEAGAHLEFSKFEKFLKSELGIAPSDIVRSSLNDSLVVSDAPKIESSDSQVLMAAVAGLLAGSRPVLGLNLALSLVPVWIKTGEYATGVQCLQEGLTHFDVNANLIEIELAQIAIAELLAASRDPEAARNQLGKWLPNLTHDHPKIRAQLLCSKMELIAHRGTTARHYALLALSNPSITDYLQLHVDALIFAAKAAFLLDDQVQITQLVDQCLSLIKPLNDLHAFAECTVLSVHGLLACEDTETARSMVHQAITYLQDRQGVPALFSRITMYRLLDEIGDLDAAAEGYRQGIIESKSLEHTYSEVIAETYLGDLLTTKGNFEQSLAHHKSALRIRTQHPDPLGRATSLRGIGRAQIGLGKISEARKSLEESAQAFLSCGGMPGHVSVLYELTRVAILTGEIPLAHRLATRTMDLASAMTEHQIISIGPTGRYLREDLHKLVTELEVKKKALDPA